MPRVEPEYTAPPRQRNRARSRNGNTSDRGFSSDSKMPHPVFLAEFERIEMSRYALSGSKLCVGSSKRSITKIAKYLLDHCKKLFKLIQLRLSCLKSCQKTAKDSSSLNITEPSKINSMLLQSYFKTISHNNEYNLKYF